MSDPYEVSWHLRDYDEPQIVGSCESCDGDLYDDDVCERAVLRLCGECDFARAEVPRNLVNSPRVRTQGH